MNDDDIASPAAADVAAAPAPPSASPAAVVASVAVPGGGAAEEPAAGQAGPPAAMPTVTPVPDLDAPTTPPRDPPPASKPRPAASDDDDDDEAQQGGAAGPSRTPAPFKPRVLRDELIGKVLHDRYEILARLGQGGMGAVYKARQLSVNREVAVKVMHGTGSDDPTQVKRFFREAEAASQLNSRHTIKVIDFGQTEDHHYMVMELLHGVSLEAELAKGPIAPPRALRLARQICLSLKEAHARGIIHRDLKPSNINLEPTEDEPEIAKVLDFGIAKWQKEGVSRLTMAGSLYGTPRYMSPEHCQSLALDARSDLYSLGVMLYEMVSGQPLFDAGNPTAVIMAQVTQEPTPLVMVVPGIPRGVAALIHKLLAKKPENRFSSAEDVVQAIDALGLGTGVPSQPQARTLPAHDSMTETAPAKLGAAGVVLDDEKPQDATVQMDAESLRQAIGQRNERQAAPPPRRSWVWLAVPAAATVLLGMGLVMWGRGQLAFAPVAPPGLVALVGTPEADTPAPGSGSPVFVQVKRSGKPHGEGAAAGPAAPGAPTDAAAAAPSLPGSPTAAGVGKVEPKGPAAGELPPAQPAAPSPTVRIQVRTDPSRAYAVVNDVLVRETPVIFELVRGDTPVNLKVRRTGFKEVAQKVVPDRNQEIMVTLVPEK